LSERDSELQARNQAVEEVRSELALTLDQSEQTQSDVRSQIETLRSEYESAKQDIEALRADLEAAGAENANLRQAGEQLAADFQTKVEELKAAQKQINDKDAALDQAFLRVAALQNTLEARETSLGNTQMELQELQERMAEIGSIREELEQKLASARGDVAGELALLTSTMVRMKDDELKQANRRILSLTSELDALRGIE
jgi:chromosome segregation ATPase